MKKEETENVATSLFVPEVPKSQTSTNTVKVKSLKAGSKFRIIYII